MFGGTDLSSVKAVQAADPAALAGALFTLTEDEIAELPVEQAEALVLATQRVVSAVTARQRSAMETVARRCDERVELDAADAVQSLCATHHGFKHHAGWQVEMDELGVCTWTAPDGRTHTTWPMDRHGYQAA